MSERSALLALADRMGIVREYVDQAGHRRTTTDATRVALLRGMRLDVATAADAAHALEAVRQEERELLIDPVLVSRAADRDAHLLRIQLPIGVAGKTVAYRLELQHEDGRATIVEGEMRPRHGARASLQLPCALAIGYHTLTLTIALPAQDRVATQWRIVCPASCLPISERVGRKKVFGVWTNLYSLRNPEDWGVGDFMDLEVMIDWAREVGAAFVGINPVHALTNEGRDISPYSPLSRLFRNELCLGLSKIPEYRHPNVQVVIRADGLESELRSLRGSDQINHARVKVLKTRVLRALHSAFVEEHRGRETPRGTGYASFLSRQGKPLQDFATFRVLQEHLRNEGYDPGDWRSWPTDYRDAESKAVTAFRRGHSNEVDFHCYVQFALDEQLSDLARISSAALPIGIYGDLALGCAPGGSDTWSFPHLFARHVHVGAPPDDFAPHGQDWGLPPLLPRALRHDRYRYWTGVVRSALEHAGALRVDHVMGLFRQFWIPAGGAGSAGSYVRYPARDLLGILALESHRRTSLVIGEDLGTVPRGLQSLLARWNILSSRVLYFERNRLGRFRPAARYSKRAMVVAHTHDQVPLAGFSEGRDLHLRRQVGAIESDEQLHEQRRQRRRERDALWRRFRAEGLVGAHDPPDGEAFCEIAYAFLSRTPSALLGVSLDDLAGEAEPVNLPGVSLDDFPSWSRRQHMPVHEILAHARTQRVLSVVRDRRWQQPPRRSKAGRSTNK